MGQGIGIEQRGGRGRRALAVAAFALLPLAGFGELVAGEVQHARVPSWSDWVRAADAAKHAKRPGDAVLIAPRWAAPLGREALDAQQIRLGKPMDDAIDVRLAARADLETYRRALELSIRGHDDPDVKGWRLVSEQRFGMVSLRTIDNPAPKRLVRDLVDEIDSTATVYRASPLGAHEACRWEPAGAQHPVSLFNGPVPSPSRWLCPPWDPAWTTVGPTVLTDLDYLPRRCIWMHPVGDAITTIELPARPIGDELVGHLGVHVFEERELKGAPVLGRVSIAGRKVAEVRHVDGDGFQRFSASTADVAGQRLPVKLELWAEHGEVAFRWACMAVELLDARGGR